MVYRQNKIGHVKDEKFLKVAYNTGLNSFKDMALNYISLKFIQICTSVHDLTPRDDN